MSQFARSYSFVAALFVGTVFMPSSLNAQQGTAVDRDSIAVGAGDITMPRRGMIVDSAQAAGPRVARAGITLPAVGRQPGVASPQSGRDNVGAGPNVAMMAVGAAGIVVGSMVGGDGGTMIAIGGGVIGLIGLFRYLR